MWESLGEVVKVFFDKHLIPTILSLVLGTVVLLITPKDFWMLMELTKAWFWLFVSGCIFLIIQLVIYLYSKWKDWRYSNYLEAKRKTAQEQEKEECIRNLWDYIDTLNIEDREYVKRFLKNKNQPITIKGIVHYSYGRLLASKHVRKQEAWDGNCLYTKYILEEEFYNALVYSAQRYGKISRFEEV